MREAGATDICTYPTRGLRGKIDHGTNDDRSNDGTPQHQSPSNIVIDSAKRDGDNITEGDTKCGPHLPLHDKGTANRCRGALSSINWRGCGFRADSEAKYEAGNEKLGPGIGEGFPYRSKTGDDTRPKDTPTTTNQPVNWARKPTRQPT